jgi:hypothetical protein
LIDYGGREAGGVDLQRQDALLAQGAEEDFATVDDLLGGYVAEHFAGRGGAFAKEFAEFGLGDHGEENEMAVGQAGDALNYLGGGGSFGEIGEPDYEAAALLEGEQSFGGTLVIGFQLFAFYLGQAFEERADVA